MPIVAALAGGCRSSDAEPIRLAVGTAPKDRVELTPSHALVEYTELPNTKNELRIQLADYEIDCSAFVPPDEGKTLLTITLVTPPNDKPGPGEYPWTGALAMGRVASRGAIPAARLGARAAVLPPGGSVRLRRVDLSAHGSVEGVLDLEFAGDGKLEATSVRGAFAAKMCRFNPSETP